MAMQMNFRSAFNGFNREDVVHYIEYLNTKHATELTQLQSELEAQRNQTPAEPAPVNEDILAQQAARIRELFDRCAALEQELESAKAVQAERDQLLNQLNELKSDNSRLTEQQVSYRSRMEDELEAYRRAERTERFARERAEDLYRQANGALADATAKVDDAATQVGKMTDKVIAQLAELQDAVAGSKQALRDAAATMYTIRPTTDKN